jgi:hypothetical protein
LEFLGFLLKKIAVFGKQKGRLFFPISAPTDYTFLNAEAVKTIPQASIRRREGAC